MPYSEILIKPMREDLTRIGVEETRSPEQVEEAIKNTKGTLLVVVNSVCGCAAGRARPGVAMARWRPGRTSALQAILLNVSPTAWANAAKSMRAMSVAVVLRNTGSWSICM